MKLLVTLSGLAVAAILAAPAPSFAAHPGHDNDAGEFESFATDYQAAMNSYNVEQLIPRLGHRLDLWMPLGIQVKTPDQFREYMKAMANKIGIGNGGTYRIVEKPKSIIRYYKNGRDDVYSAGTMTEEVQFAGKTPRQYSSHWLVHLVKLEGHWKVVGGSLDADPDRQVFTASDIAGWKADIEAAMKPAGKSVKPQGGK